MITSIGVWSSHSQGHWSRAPRGSHEARTPAAVFGSSPLSWCYKDSVGSENMAITKADDELDTHMVYRWSQTWLAGAQAKSIAKCSHHCRMAYHTVPQWTPTVELNPISTPSAWGHLPASLTSLMLLGTLSVTSDFRGHPPQSVPSMRSSLPLESLRAVTHTMTMAALAQHSPSRGAVNSLHAP